MMLAMMIPQASAEFDKCARPNGVWAGYDQVITCTPTLVQTPHASQCSGHADRVMVGLEVTRSRTTAGMSM